MKKALLLCLVVLMFSILGGYCTAANDINSSIGLEMKTSCGLTFVMDQNQTYTLKNNEPFYFTATIQSFGQLMSGKILFHDYDVANDITYCHAVNSDQEFSVNTNINSPRDHKYQLTTGKHELTFIYYNEKNEEVSKTFYVVVLPSNRNVGEGGHIDINDQGPNVNDISVYQGDSSKVKAELWGDMLVGSDLTLVDREAYMSIYDENGEQVYYDTKKTNWLGNVYFHTPSNLSVGKYRLQIGSHDYTAGSNYANLVVFDPVKDNLNAGTGNWIINTNNIIHGQNQTIDVAFINETHMADYNNRIPDKNSELGNISYLVIDNEDVIVKNGSIPLKFLNNQIALSGILDTSDLIPGNYLLRIQFNGNHFIKPSNTETHFNIYPGDSELSVSNESTLNVTQGNVAQVIAWINNDGLSKISAKHAPKANVTFTVFDQDNKVITGDTFPATLIDGHYIAYMDWNTTNFKPGTYKVHLAVNGNPCLPLCDTWTNITIMPK